MHFEFIESAGMIALFFAAVAAVFWIIVTILIHRVGKGEASEELAQYEQELEDDVDAIIQRQKEQSGLHQHPPITS
ncbi:hypothetical protein [Nisaea sp.]|uniref:hypothetical protein n=1 Tax=Nisaea sp. TaxID=2024842 RepID=UPI003B52AD9D